VISVNNGDHHMTKSFPFGAWKVTRDEFERARNIAEGDDEVANAAYQLVRYCRGDIFQRDPAAEMLRMMREGEVQ
jgi:hypothetical protein